MSLNKRTLFIEIDYSEFIFTVVEKDDIGEFKKLRKFVVPFQETHDYKIVDFNSMLKIFKRNIFLLEQELSINLKDVIVLLNNCDCSIINFSGYKKLNGSQLVKENVTYILNSLKSKITEIENEKTILHIFNSKFLLDKKDSENLPIGLFGKFYSHELSFFLVDSNELRNLNNILNKFNLNLKKIISKNFIEGAITIKQNLASNNFFKIEKNKNNSKIVFFENSSFKFIQNFKFGTEIVLKDISKITGLKLKTISNFLLNSKLSTNYQEEFVEKEFFEQANYRKIKKKLIIDIAKSRIQEMSEILIFKNINTLSFLKNKPLVFMIINDQPSKINFSEIYNSFFSKNKKFDLKFLEKNNSETLLNEAINIVQYGWKKEAVPIIHEKKSIITRFFDLFFRT